MPDESRRDTSGKEPARCFSTSVEDFLARMLGFAFTGTMWAFAGVVIMPWLYASAFNRALISLGVGFGLSVNSWCGSPAASRFSCCAVWGNGLLREQQPAWRGCWSSPSQCWKRDSVRLSGKNHPERLLGGLRGGPGAQQKKSAAALWPRQSKGRGPFRPFLLHGHPIAAVPEANRLAWPRARQAPPIPPSSS